MCDELAHFHVSIVAEAHYNLAEIHRMRGDLDAAEDSIREAMRLGREPQPGLALLRLAPGPRRRRAGFDPGRAVRGGSAIAWRGPG